MAAPRRQPPPPPPGHKHIAMVPTSAFDPLRVNWGGPEQARTEVCSYCDGPLPEVPLIFWTRDGWCAEFCEACALVNFGMVATPSKDEDEDGADYT